MSDVMPPNLIKAKKVELMERHEIVEHVRITLSAVLGREIVELSADVRLLEDLELNSMRFIELLTALEDTLGVEVDPDSLEPEVFQSVDAFVEYVSNRMPQAESGT
ncbi:acyl carrier protein [Streptomyces sp. TBY4]|uniref:acyl carrier protein n=1 Tax=Streptomyces sp. TBY4 TaxID=2962030 RepID=UPI0020B82B3A|nr:acyl carrier protein [Streptomyces sp. TBY4]MCP3760521.1 acyl carrier protein [Streptomyces sp. TBY4]